MALDVSLSVDWKSEVKLVAILDALCTIYASILVMFKLLPGYLSDGITCKIVYRMILHGAISGAQIYSAGILCYGLESINPKYANIWLFVAGVIVIWSTLLLVDSIGSADQVVFVYAAVIIVYKCCAVVLVGAFKASLIRLKEGEVK